MSHQRYITSAHRAVISQLIDRAIEVTESGRCKAIAEYSGVCDECIVSVYPACGPKPGNALYHAFVKLPVAGDAHTDSLNRLAEALNYLESLLEERQP